MNDQEREVLRLAVERDIGLVMAACVPLDWPSGRTLIEEKEVLGCLHPIAMLMVDNSEELKNGKTHSPIVRCHVCNNVLDPEVVAIRLDEARKTR